MEDFFGNYGTWVLLAGMFGLMMFMHRGHGHAGGGGCCGGGEREPQKREDSQENVDVKGSADRPAERPRAGSCH